MATDIKTDLHIPDLWFDVYARLFPGVVFVAACRLIALGNSTIPSTIELLLLAGAGYLASLVAHPVTGWLTAKVHGWRAAKRELKAT